MEGNPHRTMESFDQELSFVPMDRERVEAGV